MSLILSCLQIKYTPATIVPLFKSKIIMFIYFMVYYFHCLVSPRNIWTCIIFSSAVNARRGVLVSILFIWLLLFEAIWQASTGKTNNVLGLTPNNSLPFFELFFEPFFQDSTTAVLHTVDNDMVIGLMIDSPPANITSVFCCCFLQSLHSVATFLCTLIFWGLIILFIFVKSSNNKNILTTKKVELRYMVCTSHSNHATILFSYDA